MTLALDRMIAYLRDLYFPYINHFTEYLRTLHHQPNGVWKPVREESQLLGPGAGEVPNPEFEKECGETLDALDPNDQNRPE